MFPYSRHRRRSTVRSSVKMYSLSINSYGILEKGFSQVFVSHLPNFANTVSLGLYEPSEFGYIIKNEIVFGILEGMIKSSLFLLSQVLRNLSSATLGRHRILLSTNK